MSEPIAEALEDLIQAGSSANFLTGPEDARVNTEEMDRAKAVVLDTFKEAGEVLGWLIDMNGSVGMHEETFPPCPEDDTCRCPKVERVNAIANKLTAIEAHRPRV